MAKPEKIRSSGAALLADGIQLKRVQSLSTDIDITRDQVLELANAGVVQFVEQSPVVTVSIDTNEFGATNNLALLAGRAINKLAASNDEDTREGYYFKDINSSSSQAFLIDEGHMLDGYTTLAVPILEDQSATTVARTMIVPRAGITGYSLNYDVGGIATENFTMQSNDKYWYLNDWRDCRVFKMTNHHVGHSSDATQEYFMADATDTWSATSQAFYFLSTPLGGSSYPNGATYQDYNFDIEGIALIVNDKVYTSTVAGNDPYYFSTARIGGGLVAMGVAGLPSGVSTPFAQEGDDVWLVFDPPTNQTWAGVASDSSNPGYALVSTSGSYGGAGKGFITAFLYNQAGPSGQTDATAAGQTLRIQTVTFDLSFTVENLDELGTFQSYGIVKQTPVPVNVTVTANDSDLEMWGRTGEKSILTDRELMTELFSTRNYVRIDVYKEKTKLTKLRTITSTGMSVIGESHNVAVGGIAAQEFTFTCDNITIQGLGVEP
jgi:hypothetical protein